MNSVTSKTLNLFQLRYVLYNEYCASDTAKIIYLSSGELIKRPC